MKLHYVHNAETLEYLINYLSKAFGTPTGTPDKQKSGESLNWLTERLSYSIMFLGTKEKALHGEEDYYLLIRAQ